MVYDADGNSYQITRRFKNGNVTIIGSDKTKIKMTMKELEENYKLENEVYNPTSPTGEYNLTPEEDETLKKSQNTVNEFIDSDTLENKAFEEALTANESDIKNSLFNKIINCQ
jgi:hypothetical protein